MLVKGSSCKGLTHDWQLSEDGIKLCTPNHHRRPGGDLTCTQGFCKSSTHRRGSSLLHLQAIAERWSSGEAKSGLEIQGQRIVQRMDRSPLQQIERRALKGRNTTHDRRHLTQKHARSLPVFQKESTVPTEQSNHMVRLLISASATITAHTKLSSSSRIQVPT